MQRMTLTQRPAFRVVWIALLLAVAGCDVTVLGPEPEEECDEEPCELVMVLRVIRTGNTYVTNELDIWDNKLAFDCRRTLIDEQFVIIGNVALTWTKETWECYRCPNLVDTFNAEAAVYLNEVF